MRAQEYNAWEADAVARARAGDHAAFEEIYHHYERQLYGFIIRTIADVDDAADLTQQTFVKAYAALPTFGVSGREANLSAWLHRIAVNVCLDVLRRRQRIRWLPWEASAHDQLLHAPPADDPERAAESRETCVTVRRALDAMKPRHRSALLLIEYEAMTCAEIGEVMGLSRSAVKSMLFRAREEFRRIYNSMVPEPIPDQRPINPPRPRKHSPSPWTEAEVAEAARLRAAGWDCARIGRALGRSSVGVGKILIRRGYRLRADSELEATGD